jgi:hypothetical protein
MEENLSLRLEEAEQVGIDFALPAPGNNPLPRTELPLPPR